MSGIWKAAVILVALAAIGCGAASATNNEFPPHFTEEEAIGLAYTYLLSLSINSDSPLMTCLGNETSSAKYRDFMWVVRHGPCIAGVDDFTGEVTGPIKKGDIELFVG